MFSRSVWKQLKSHLHQQKNPMSVVVKRKNHSLSRKQVSPNALKVLYRLQKAGFDAFLVGGSVRDILLRRPTKDFDVVTNALPEEIYKLFSNSRIIGRRFRLVHIMFHKEIIECSTFRAGGGDDVGSVDDDGHENSENIFGSIEEDAWRRDFTVNSLYYNIEDFSIIDYTGGIVDLRERVMRIVGDPEKRFTEDPVRLLRAIRLAAKLGFSMHPETDKVVLARPDLLSQVPPSRIFHEFLKLFFFGHATVTYSKMTEYGYMKALFPGVSQVLTERALPTDLKLIDRALKATDDRFHAKKSINPGFLVAVFLWPVVRFHEQQLKDIERKPHARFMRAMDLALSNASELMHLPHRMVAMIRAMWRMQQHLENPKARRVDGLYAQRYFRAAYDLLELRAQAGETRFKWPHWWRSYQKSSTKMRDKLLRKLKEQQPGKRH
jgi:poly(A) polymerase